MRISDALEITHQGAPAAPVSSRTLLYVKSDNRVYTKRSDGTETDVGSWANLTGKPTSFTPDAHTHALTDLATTGTNSQFLRGDRTWQVPYTNPTQAEAEAGTAVSNRVWTAERVKQAIQALAPVKYADLASKSDAGHIHSGTYEPVILAATVPADKYWRGDKTWQVLDKAAVGLGNVDNTADADKPVSGPVAIALGAKLNNATDSGQLNAVSPFAGYVRLVKIGPMVFVVGEITRASGFSGTFTNVGVTASAAFYPSGAFTLTAQPFYNAAGSYRFRVTAGGSVEVQQTTTTGGQTMTLNGFYPANTP